MSKMSRSFHRRRNKRECESIRLVVAGSFGVNGRNTGVNNRAIHHLLRFYIPQHTAQCTSRKATCPLLKKRQKCILCWEIFFVTHQLQVVKIAAKISGRKNAKSLDVSRTVVMLFSWKGAAHKA